MDPITAYVVTTAGGLTVYAMPTALAKPQGRATDPPPCHVAAHKREEGCGEGTAAPGGRDGGGRLGRVLCAEPVA